jgi:hypothetical protein
MTRAQVDRHLWGFTKGPTAPYNAVPPGGSVVSYHAFGVSGKFAEITVVYGSDGKVADPIPIFDN